MCLVFIRESHFLAQPSILTWMLPCLMRDFLKKISGDKIKETTRHPKLGLHMFIHVCIFSHAGTFTYTKIKQYNNMYESQKHHHYVVKNIIVKEFIPCDPSMKPRWGQASWKYVQELFPHEGYWWWICSKLYSERVQSLSSVWLFNCLGNYTLKF